jgi:hypothetical protein
VTDIRTDALVLDIGGSQGALVIYADAGADGCEIEISPVGHPAARTHNVVHARATGRGVRHTAVFPAVTAGDYTVWRDADLPHGTVTVSGGSVVEYIFRPGP